MGVNLWRLFRQISDSVPSRDAVRWRKRSITYGQLAEDATRLANVLIAHGMGIHRERAELADWEIGQDSVALYLLNGPEYMIGTLGAYAARATAVNVNYRYVADELTYLLDDASAGAIVYHARFAPTLREVVPRLRRPPLLLQVADDSGHPLLDGAIDLYDALAAASPGAPTVAHSPDDLYVLYTGGTTGMPKGTLWRQTDIYQAALAPPGVTTLDVDELTRLAVERGARFRFVPNAPFMHGAAHWFGLRAVTSGGTIVINDIVDRLDPVDAWSVAERERATVMLMVGETMARPLAAELESGRYNTSSIKALIVGGAVTSPATKQRLLELLPPGATITDSAGASETGRAISSVSTRESTAELGVFTADAGAVVLNERRTAVLEPGADEIGWLATCGPVPLGYLGDERKTRETFPVIAGRRWAVPGDRARHRADGTIELLGRDSVTINTGGEKVFAEEIEQALITNPAIADVVVVGRPSERWGHEVVAIVALTDPTVTDDELRASAGTTIARYKIPKDFIRVAEVLRSPAGKADYRWARDVATRTDEPMTRSHR